LYYRDLLEEVVMTAQHALPTPLWRRVISLPRTRLGWLSVVLIAVPVALFFFGVIVYEEQLLEVPGWVDAILSQYVPMALSLLAGAVVGLIALLRSQERSVLVWLPLALAPGLPIAFLVQWLRWVLRHGLSIVPTVLFLVGMMALIAALHFLQRQSERYGLGGTISSVASFVGVALIAAGALIGRVSQNWLLGTNLMGWGLLAASVGLAGLAIVTLRVGVFPWWGGAALIAANPLLLLIWFSPLGPHLGGIWLVVVPMLVVGFAVFLAARRRNERAARAR
jgi:hypothetical protein